MSGALLEFYLDSFGGEAPELVCIDMDPSAHLLYGQQELGLYNAHVGDTCLMPLYVFDGCTGRVMAAVLREGSVPRAGEILAVLQERLVGAVRSRFPGTRVMLRARQPPHQARGHGLDGGAARRGGRRGRGLARRGVCHRPAEATRRSSGSSPAEIREAQAAARGTVARATGDRRRRAHRLRGGGLRGGELGAPAQGGRPHPRRPRGHRRALRGDLARVRQRAVHLQHRLLRAGRGGAVHSASARPSAATRAPAPRAPRPTPSGWLLHAAAYAVLHRFREVVLAGTRWARAMLSTTSSCAW